MHPLGCVRGFPLRARLGFAISAPSGPVSGSCCLRASSLWPGAFPPLLPPAGGPCGLRALVQQLPRYYAPVRLPKSVHRCIAPVGFATRTLDHPQSQTWDLPVPVQRTSIHARLSDHAEPHSFLRWRGYACCLPLEGQRRHSEAVSFRGSITRPAWHLSTLRLQTLRSQAHDSVSMRVAGPSSCKTFTHYPLPVSRRTPSA